PSGHQHSPNQEPVATPPRMYPRDSDRGPRRGGRRSSHGGGGHRHDRTQREGSPESHRDAASAPAVALGLPALALARGGHDRPEPQDTTRAGGSLTARQLAA